MSAYAGSVSIRKLFAVFVALAVLVAPSVTGAALAASPHHAMQMMEAGHCEAPPPSGNHQHRMDGKTCCISMCMALAVAPTAPAETATLLRQIAQFAPPKAYHGLPAEIATPPPRHS